MTARHLLLLTASGVLACSSKRAAPEDSALPPLIDAMAPVPAGWFSLGCSRMLATSDELNAEHEARVPDQPAMDDDRMFYCVFDEPPRRVWISTFEIDRFEVTRDEYERCLDSGPCERRPPPDWEKIRRGMDRAPVVATFEDAERFCVWRGKRLPTNAEWEKAARGTDDRIYPWGDVPPTCELVGQVDFLRDGFMRSHSECATRPSLPPGRAHPAGTSIYGVEDLLDLPGEWVSDWHVRRVADPKHLGIARDLRPIGDGPHFTYSKNTSGPYPVLEYDWDSVEWALKDPALIDPQGPPEPTGPGVRKHAIKGYWGIPGMIDRGEDRDDTHREYAGFRCARSIAGPPPPDVKSPGPGEFTFPYREPGYTPPGTRPLQSTNRTVAPVKAKTKSPAGTRR